MGERFASEPKYPEAVSHLLRLLFEGEEGDLGCESASPLSPASSLAFHAKASELASIVNQDSPGLFFSSAHHFSLPPFEAAWSSAMTDVEDLGCELASPVSPASSIAFHAKASELASIVNQDSPGLFFSCAAHHFFLPPFESSHQNFVRPPQSRADLIQSFLAPPPPRVLMPTLSPLYPPAEQYGGGHRDGHRTNNSRYLYEDIHDMMIECAHQLGCGDNTNSAVVGLLGKVREFASPNGSAAERVAYYFAKALDARLSGGHRQQQRPAGPSPDDILKAIFMYMTRCPLAKVFHYFLKEVVLDVAKGARKLYILEDIVTTFPYRSLFKELAAARPAAGDSPSPPQVHLIAANMSQFAAISDYNFVLETLEERGRQLSACASLYGVPFQFTAWTKTMEAFDFTRFAGSNRHENEKLIIFSGYPVHFVYDDFLTPPIERVNRLMKMRSLNPDLYIQGFAVGSYNTASFPWRVREALFHFECLFDMLDTFTDRDNVDRGVFEGEILGMSILNIVAYEGANVVQRVSMYKEAHALTKQAGFKQLILSTRIPKRIRDILNRWHKLYTIAEDLEYLLMGWKGRILHALSLWTTPERVFGEGSLQV
ncbi:hypothetical protein GOP47_0000032 [Adiantum capillus-veneris]|uniref:Uncharacterized protein n=1 Tax=Adiantum capillus-veneris TaxID=13818 RepID=A0A9D4VCS5_ADICA|nr:hypothetical protein GOP47_0000032 [Adiantum capillus-veneris]